MSDEDEIDGATDAGLIREVGDKLAEEVGLLEGLLKAVLDTSFDPVIVSDAEGVVLTCNQRAVILFGYPNEASLIGRPVSILVPERLRSAHEEGLSRSSKGALIGVSAAMPSRRVCGLKLDGTEIELEVRIGSYKTSHNPLKVCHVAYLQPVD